MRLDDFHFHLPESSIALYPLEPRDSSRLLTIDGNTWQSHHRIFRDLPHHLKQGDLLVLNNTEVFPARLQGEDANGRKFECFLLSPLNKDESRWKCLLKPAHKMKETPLTLNFPGLRARCHREPGHFEIEFDSLSLTRDWLNKKGTTPLPPYIKRPVTDQDRWTYQTVYAKSWGSVAAPTAGLHFTPELLNSLTRKGIEIRELTLHVGYGTFAPVRSHEIENHLMHEENFEISVETFEAVLRAKKEGRRIVAVGTTSLRALESMEKAGGAGTRKFIRPGYQFKVVNGLITNFHLPQSSLYILVCSILGVERARTFYENAVQKSYRFYSYGDAMLILPFPSSTFCA